MSNKVKKPFRPVRFIGVGVVNPHGTEHERRFLHPNAAKVWSRKSF
ncbi:MAG: hypothetical protein ABJM29_18160 [Rhizobiaceae bacterium]